MICFYWLALHIKHWGMTKRYLTRSGPAQARKPATMSVIYVGYVVVSAKIPHRSLNQALGVRANLSEACATPYPPSGHTPVLDVSS